MIDLHSDENLLWYLQFNNFDPILPFENFFFFDDNVSYPSTIIKHNYIKPWCERAVNSSESRFVYLMLSVIFTTTFINLYSNLTYFYSFHNASIFSKVPNFLSKHFFKFSFGFIDSINLTTNYPAFSVFRL